MMLIVSRKGQKRWGLRHYKFKDRSITISEARIGSFDCTILGLVRRDVQGLRRKGIRIGALLGSMNSWFMEWEAGWQVGFLSKHISTFFIHCHSDALSRK